MAFSKISSCNREKLPVTIFKYLYAVHSEACSASLRYYAEVSSILRDVSCNEQSRNVVQDCSFNVLSRSTAECSLVLNIVCLPRSNCTEGAFRLVDGKSPLNGRFEVCVNGYWGALPAPVSNYNGYPSTELEKAERICRQFGFPWECELAICVCVHVCVSAETALK